MEHFKQKTLQNFRLLRIIFKDLMAYNTEIDEKNDQWKTWKIQPNEGRIYRTVKLADGVNGFSDTLKDFAGFIAAQKIMQKIQHCRAWITASQIFGVHRYAFKSDPCNSRSATLFFALFSGFAIVFVKEKL